MPDIGQMGNRCTLSCSQRASPRLSYVACLGKTYLIFLAVWPSSSAIEYVEEKSAGRGAMWHLDVLFL